MTRQSPPGRARKDAGHTARIVLDGQEIALSVRRNRRARRVSLRIDAANDCAVLVLPPQISLSEGLGFAQSKAAWLRDRLNALPRRTPFADGARIPVLGKEYTIRHHPGLGPAVWREGTMIHVGGDEDTLGARVRDWLGEVARREITRRARAKAAVLGKSLSRITLRDSRSRWGSCSANGNLAFSWRLILAPEEVLDYVVGHEVAHLAEMNHGPRHSRLVERLVPDTVTQRAWLRRMGGSLLRYG